MYAIRYWPAMCIQNTTEVNEDDPSIKSAASDIHDIRDKDVIDVAAQRLCQVDYLHSYF